jgi:hypothetical protein
VRDGDTLVVTKLNRLARFLPDAGHHRGTDQTEGEAQHRRVHPRPRRPVGRLLFNVLAVVAEFEFDLNRAPPAKACRSPGERPAPRQTTQTLQEPGSPPSPYIREDNTPPPRSPNCSRSHGAPCTGSTSEPSAAKETRGPCGGLKAPGADHAHHSTTLRISSSRFGRAWVVGGHPGTGYEGTKLATIQVGPIRRISNGREGGDIPSWNIKTSPAVSMKMISS